VLHDLRTTARPGATAVIRCFFCDNDAAAGWVCGVPPASERYKLALCPTHDNPGNRKRVQAAWDELIREEMQTWMDLARRHAKAPVRWELRIRFMEGGEVSVACSSYEVSKEKDLLVLTDKGELQFYPLQHVHSFKALELPQDLPAIEQGAPEQDEDSG
jgi:hypothetical protein